MTKKPDRRRVVFARALKELGFARDGSERDPLFYVLHDGDRRIEVQLWKDGRHRASHLLRGYGTTAPTNFINVPEMRKAIEHERTRTDHKVLPPGFEAAEGVSHAEKTAEANVIRPPAGQARACRVCGCTTNRACVGGCWWVARDLCSSCVVSLDAPTFEALMAAACTAVIAETEVGKNSTSTRGRSRQAFRRAWRAQHPEHFKVVSDLRRATIGALVAGGVVSGRRAAEQLLP